MMKAIHFADYHLGLDAGPIDPLTRLPGRTADFLDMLDSLIDFGYEERVDVVLFAGDMFHRSNPSPTLLRELGTRIVRLSKLCKVIILPGNHDTPGSLDRASAVDVFSSLRVDNVEVLADYGNYQVDIGGGTLQITGYPYPFKHRLLTNAERAGDSDLFRQRCESVLDLLADDMKRNGPAVMLGHFSVNTAVFGSERAMTIGEHAELGLSCLEDGPWDYVALGHIHLHQSLSDKKPVIYAGSLDRVDFSEANDPKGFVLVDLEAPERWEFIEVDARPFITIYADLRGTRHPTDKLLQQIARKELEGAVVRLSLDTPSNGLAAVNMASVYEALTKAGAYYVANVSTNPERQTRELELEEGQSLTALSDMEKLKVYFRSMDVPWTKGLKQLATEIMEDVDGEEN